MGCTGAAIKNTTNYRTFLLVNLSVKHIHFSIVEVLVRLFIDFGNYNYLKRHIFIYKYDSCKKGILFPYEISALKLSLI